MKLLASSKWFLIYPQTNGGLVWIDQSLIIKSRDMIMLSLMRAIIHTPTDGNMYSICGKSRTSGMCGNSICLNQKAENQKNKSEHRGV